MMCYVHMMFCMHYVLRAYDVLYALSAACIACMMGCVHDGLRA